MKEKLWEKVVEVRRKSDRVMAIVLVLRKKLRVVCAYAPQVGRSECEEDQFYCKMTRQVSGVCKTLVK